MRASGAIRLVLLCLALLAGSFYQLSQRPPEPSQPQTDRRESSARPRETPATPERGYDLEADERLGGHTIERHIAKTDEDLAARLRREPQISAASTYTDLETARHTVASALASSRVRVTQWEARDGSRPNLVLRYTAPRGSPVGRSLERGARTATPTRRALVVLRWHDRRNRWYVLTSYPEADR
jgi:hypothetical protein